MPKPADLSPPASARPAAEARFGPKGDARRRVLIKAGYRTVLAHGMAGLTFRAVAAEAGVPLGSASYYFADKNVLLLEVVTFARRRVLRAYRRIEERVASGTCWIVALSDHVACVTGDDRLALARDYEMFLFGFEHPDLIEISRSWITLTNDSLSRILPGDLVVPVSYMLEGMYLTAAKTDRRFSSSEVRAILECLAPRGQRDQAGSST